MSSNGAEMEPAARTAAQFATTHWSVVLAAGESASPDSREALEELCRAYWYPLYAYARRTGHSPEDAQDLTQGFFEHLLQSRLVASADAAVDEGGGAREPDRLRGLLQDWVDIWPHIFVGAKGVPQWTDGDTGQEATFYRVVVP